MTTCCVEKCVALKGQNEFRLLIFNLFFFAASHRWHLEKAAALKAARACGMHSCFLKSLAFTVTLSAFFFFEPLVHFIKDDFVHARRFTFCTHFLVSLHFGMHSRAHLSEPNLHLQQYHTKHTNQRALTRSNEKTPLLLPFGCCALAVRNDAVTSPSFCISEQLLLRKR